MAKAKTANKSKPAKKTVRKTFHRQAAKKPLTPAAETTPQTDQGANQTAIPAEIQSDTQATPTDIQPQQTKEITAPPAPETAATSTENTTQETSQNTAEKTPDSELTPAPVEPQEPAQPTESLLSDQDDGKFKKPLISIAVIVVILITLASLYFLYTKKLKTSSQKPQPTPVTQISESSPEPSPQTLNKADWTLEILNGSAKKGAAAALAEKLTAKGYQIIKTGNAPEDINESQVFFTDSIKNQADLFLEDIKDELPSPTNAGSLQDSTASARIIIGVE